MILQAINDIAAICAAHGISDAILSPGSRCAPISIAFVRHPDIQTRSISDERSAAFIALGISQKSKSPTVCVCTSGSAAYNYAPAVAEAFFQQVPMLILTADRPPEWIDQLDGQTIRQDGIFGTHVKKAYNFPVDYQHPDALWHCNRIVNEAINMAKASPAGPVHINIPLREPFYPEQEESFSYSSKPRIIQNNKGISILSADLMQVLQKEWQSHEKRLLVLGQNEKDSELILAIQSFAMQQQLPVAAELISNGHEIPQAIHHQDVFFSQQDEKLKQSLKADLLITTGKSIISKNFKQFLRKYRPKAHWHIQASGEVADTFQSLTRILRCDPSWFFSHFTAPKETEPFLAQKIANYKQIWEIEDRKASIFFKEFFADDAFGEFKVVKEFMEVLPANCDLHLANSMAVRYANLLHLDKKLSGVEIFANRGTSGIDGSNSTALGGSISSQRQTFLITGDVAFFYDRNAFWNNYLGEAKHFKILLLNNAGGGIFRLIDGPSKQPELEEYFETRQVSNASHLAAEHGMKYLSAQEASSFYKNLSNFVNTEDGPVIFEVFTDKEVNQEVFKKYKSIIKQAYVK